MAQARKDDEMTTAIDELNLREQLVRIDKMLAETERKRQEIHYAPWVLILPVAVGLLTAGAALFAAGVAFIKLLG
jgi:hypothetical protein